MPDPTTAWTDERTEHVIGRLLRAGVALAAAVVLVGGILYLAQLGSERPHHTLFTGEPDKLRTVAGIVGDALAGYSRGIIEFGVLLLIATPVARVAFCVYAFARERDKVYTGVTLLVLAILLFSLGLGH